MENEWMKEIEERDKRIVELAAQVERMRAIEDAARHLIAFISGEKDMDECENCRAKECCACCSTQASYLENAIARTALEADHET